MLLSSLISGSSLFTGRGQLQGDVVRTRVAGDPEGSGDLFLANKKVFLMALPEKFITNEAVTDANGLVIFDWLLENHEYAVFTRASKLPNGEFFIGDYWDKLYPRHIL